MNRRRLRLLTPGSDKYVIEHARWRASRGRGPSARFDYERNPIKALTLAKRHGDIDFPIALSTIADLIKSYDNDIQYDCHPVERRYNGSFAAAELQRRGRGVLREIGNHVAKIFPEGKLSSISSGYSDFFLAWGYLLFGIVRDHGLREHCPYTSKTTFGEQDMHVWAEFCRKHAA